MFAGLFTTCQQLFSHFFTFSRSQFFAMSHLGNSEFARNPRQMLLLFNTQRLLIFGVANPSIQGDAGYAPGNKGPSLDRDSEFSSRNRRVTLPGVNSAGHQANIARAPTTCALLPIRQCPGAGGMFPTFSSSARPPSSQAWSTRRRKKSHPCHRTLMPSSWAGFSIAYVQSGAQRVAPSLKS
jgi:hypothetical protein